MGSTDGISEVAAEGFGAAAAAYEQGRPSYADDVVAWLIDRLGIAPGRAVVDLAAGTGKLTRLLVATGADLIAIEPVDAMRDQLVQVCPGVDAISGTAESIPLPATSVDALTVAQAFHWFDPAVALGEIARVLKPGGVLGIAFNERDTREPWVADLSKLIRWDERERWRVPYTVEVDWAEVIDEHGPQFAPAERYDSTYLQPMDPETLVNRVVSTSYIARLPMAEQEALADKVRDLVAPLGDHFELPYVSVAYAAPPPLIADRHQALLEWFGQRQRDLPWRRTRDPWAVLVSELMLQQTQVARVLPKYETFLEQWPTPAACAAAPLGDVVTAWAGLGYNRRAVSLHRCAQEVVSLHGGELPDDLSSLLALPGIGPYTARAVLAFAFESDEVGVLDTNAARVLARWSGRSLGRAEAQAIADASVAPSAGWAWNQAMLDLGATVCVPRSPRCDECPVTEWCAWRGAGLPEPDPAVGSAGVSTGQSRFDGSDRQGRGRLVDALRTAPVAAPDLATVMGWPDDPERAARVAAAVVVDGLATVDDVGTHHLPE